MRRLDFYKRVAFEYFVNRTSYFKAAGFSKYIVHLKPDIVDC